MLCLRRSFQGIMGASTTILIIVSPINIALNIFLVHHTSLGLLGSPFAVSITYWLCFIFLGIWTSFSSVHKENRTWGGMDLYTVLDLTSCIEFLKLALPGILMVGTEWQVNCTITVKLSVDTFRYQGCLWDCRSSRWTSWRCSSCSTVYYHDHGSKQVNVLRWRWPLIYILVSSQYPPLWHWSCRIDSSWESHRRTIPWWSQSCSSCRSATERHRGHNSNGRNDVI